MSKIFEALDNARDEVRWQRWWAEIAPPLSVAAPARASMRAMFSKVNMEEEMAPPQSVAAPARTPMRAVFSKVNMEEEMVRLHQQLDALLPREAHRVLQFISSREGEGASTTSTVVREFARVSATRFAQRVLLLEMDRRAYSAGLRDMGSDSSWSGAAPSRVGHTTFFVAPFPEDFARTRERLTRAYDLILVDSSPAAASPEGLAVSSYVDGIILVEEETGESQLLLALDWSCGERERNPALGCPREDLRTLR
jgi:Mrp family chromosome partitioning ATPase